jgi:hypothetical protein
VHCRYDPPQVDPEATNVEEDTSLLEDYYAVENYAPERLTPWLLRLVLDDRLTVDKHITMDMIQSRIHDEYEVRKGEGVWLECWQRKVGVASSLVGMSSWEFPACLVCYIGHGPEPHP